MSSGDTGAPTNMSVVAYEAYGKRTGSYRASASGPGHQLKDASNAVRGWTNENLPYWKD